MVKEEKKPHGYIYRATNEVNGKVYIGQTVTSRWGDDKNPVEERWREEVQEAYRNERRGEDLRYIERAIIKHGPENYNLREQDIAYSQEDLDSKERHWVREYDSMNPDKGYNMTEGGLGGRPNEEVRENISNIITDKWDKDPEYRDKQTNERRERAKDPEWREKMTKINREKGKDPQFKEKVSKAISEKYQKDPAYYDKQANERRERAKDPEWREKMTKINRERAKDPEWIQKMKDINRDKRKEIEDKREFLDEVKNKVPKKELVEKYGMNGKTLNKRIEEMFGPNGPKNYTELKDHLQDKNVDEVLKDIDDKSGERQDSSSENTNEDKKEETSEESKQEEDNDEKQSEEKGEELNDKESEESDEEGPEVSSEEITEESHDQSSEEGTDISDRKEEKSTQIPSENGPNESIEKLGKEKQLETLINITEDKNIRRKRSKEKRDKKDEIRRFTLTSGVEQRQPVQRSYKDYDGIDKSADDKRSDYDGIDTNSNDDKNDIKTLDGGNNEQGNDYDGIDNPQESVDKDYDEIDESYGDGGHEG